MEAEADRAYWIFEFDFALHLLVFIVLMTASVPIVIVYYCVAICDPRRGGLAPGNKRAGSNATPFFPTW